MTLPIIAGAILLWLVLGGIVAIVVCPLLKDPADEAATTTPQKAHEVAAPASPPQTRGA